MSEPKLITPLLANHVIGEAISDHNGVRCCPVMEKDTQEKYIAKIISIPASQVQLDALLLTGICRDEEAAQQYFSEQAESAVQEAALLQKLAALGGFVCFADWQVVPMENAIGYEVYLLGAYRPTLARHLSRNPMTHLGAVNLGLDLCSALSVCRQSGYLYVALKPENIYITYDGEYCIGDLGFISLDSLRFTSLPDKYRSEYTPPEVQDAYSSLNTTMDIYSVGLILYQAYNNGELPVYSEEGAIAPPAYADYEMAEIILKACGKCPEERFQTPEELGQALIDYMQRNGVQDTFIVPSAIVDELQAENLEDVQEAAVEEQEEQASAQQIEVQLDEESESPVENAEDAEAPDLDQMAFSLTDETAPNEEIVAELEETSVTEEVSEILAQADDLIEHEVPDPVQQPEPIYVPIPKPIVEEQDEPEEAQEPEASDEAAEQPAESIETVTAVVFDDEVEAVQPIVKPKRFNGLIAALIVVLVLLVLAVGGLLFYENYYVQTIDNMTLVGDKDYLTVSLDTDVDNSQLTVVCTDTYGNTKRVAVQNGQAHFTELTPSTQYKVSVEIYGFHKLIGTTSDRYTTTSRTDIVSFTAVTGAEDGSVILNFVITGGDETQWRITYSAVGEEEISREFTGHMLNVSGLTIGKTYTYTLTPVSDIYVVGNNTITHTASKLVYAENVTILGFKDGVLSAKWDAPAGIDVKSWTVRCYNDAGYDKTVSVSEPSISITDLDPTSAYTIDVCAAGMSQGRRAYVSAGSVTVNNVKLDESKSGQLGISWEFEGAATEAGWLVLYTVDGSEQQVIRCDTNKATIPSLIPGGKYSYAIQPPTGATVFGGTGTYTAPGGGKFSGYGTTADSISFRMCRTPKAGWNWYDLWERDFTTTFSVGQRASFVVAVDGKAKASNETVTVLFVIKDKAKNPVSIATRERKWSELCDEKNHGEIDIPIMPTVAGSFTMDIYFNNAYVASQAFTVTK